MRKEFTLIKRMEVLHSATGAGGLPKNNPHISHILYVSERDFSSIACVIVVYRSCYYHNILTFLLCFELLHRKNSNSAPTRLCSGTSPC